MSYSVDDIRKTAVMHGICGHVDINPAVLVFLEHNGVPVLSCNVKAPWQSTCCCCQKGGGGKEEYCYKFS